jgi:hypothetical protein
VFEGFLNKEKDMYLPRQSQPVQRTLVGRPLSGQDASGEQSLEALEQGMRGGEFGVQPSGVDWGQVVGTALPILASLF